MTYNELKNLGDISSKVLKKDSRMVDMNVPYFPTGSTVLDLVVGGSKGVFGWRSGTVVNIVGDKSTGKTLLTTETIVASHYLYGDKLKWCYDDCEAAYTFDSQGHYGIDVVSPEMPRSDTVEMAFYNITKFIESLEKDEFGIYVLDSLDALTSDEADELAEDRIKAYDQGKEFDKGSYKMGKPKYLSQEFFPQLVGKLKDKNVLLIVISQIRDNVNPMSFEKYTRAGGKALDFYASVVIWLANLKKIERNGTPVGGNVLAKNTKGKLERPFRSCQYSYYFDYGIDDVGSMIDYLFDLRLQSGELSAPLAKNIAWEPDETKLEVNSTTIKKFLMDNNLYKEAIATCKNNRFDLGTVLEFVVGNPTLAPLYEEQFQKVMERDALIAYIENNNLQDELKKRVIDKWEAFEDSIKTHRVKKYGTQPRGVEE